MDYNTIINADCLEAMAGLPEEWIDSIVTDPPYGLGFMGKAWDHGVPGVPFWIEALRVAKPGAHLLAFGGTRTFHRLAVAIEDAGWEIRDCIFWCFGSGFPKSKNIGCKCGGCALQYSHEKETVDSGQLRDVRQDISEASVLDKKNKKQLLQLQLQREAEVKDIGCTSFRPNGNEVSGNRNEGREQSSVEGRRNVLAEARQLQADQVCPLPDGVSTDGKEGRICNGASPLDGKASWSVAESDGSCPPQKPRSSGQSAGESGIISKQQGPQDSRICPKCGGILDRVGYGTALKPAWEPIIVARKPLEGTVAANVLRYRTGAINVDGCRVKTGDNLNGGAYAATGTDRNDGWGMKRAGAGEYTQPTGRWPANLIHDGSAEVVGLFPVTGGNHGGAGEYASRSGFGGGVVTQAPADTGSAARFFYCAKASKSDRDEGCEGLEHRLAGDVTGGRVEGSAGLDCPRAGAGRTSGSRNHHPTVKPTALMRYLCRLVTPPNGIVLDPFMGSGSTGKGAVLEGFGFIGIDKELEYAEISRLRIARSASMAQEVLPLEAP